MSSRNWISARHIEGNTSRQAHADMPEGTYEREMSKEGFFGPAAFFHHQKSTFPAIVLPLITQVLSTDV